MVGAIYYGGGIPSVKGRVFSTDVSHHQYEGGTSSVQWRVCSMNLSHNQYGGGCAVQDYQNSLEGSWWLYLSGKKILRYPIMLEN